MVIGELRAKHYVVEQVVEVPIPAANTLDDVNLKGLPHLSRGNLKQPPPPLYSTGQSTGMGSP